MTIETIQITDREEWLAHRKKDVTASAAGALLGEHEYVSRYGLWADKTGRLNPDPDENAAMIRGRLLEPVAAELAQMKNPNWKIWDPKVYLRDSSIRLGATPDRFVDCPVRGPGILQIKTTHDIIFKQKWRDPDTRQILLPLWIAVQAMVEAHLSGRQWAQVGLMVVGMGLDYYPIDVPIHDGVIKRIKTSVKDFWEFVDSGELMDPDYTKDGKILNNVKLGLEEEPPKDLSGDNRFHELLTMRDDLVERGKAIKEERETCETEIKAKLGNSSVAICGNRKVTWKVQKRKEFITPASEFPVLRVS